MIRKVYSDIRDTNTGFEGGRGRRLLDLVSSSGVVKVLVIRLGFRSCSLCSDSMAPFFVSDGFYVVRLCATAEVADDPL